MILGYVPIGFSFFSEITSIRLDSTAVLEKRIMHAHFNHNNMSCKKLKSTKMYQFSRKQKIIPKKKLYNFQKKPKSTLF